MRIRRQIAVLFAVIAGLQPGRALAQPAPPATPKPWTLAASGGLSLTSGNTDTTTTNVGYEVAYDAGTRNRARTDGLYLRGKNAGELSNDQLALNGRDEYRLVNGAYFFAQTQFLKDRFKEIDYLVAPTAGLGYRLTDSPLNRLSVSIGLGRIWEKNRGVDVAASGVLTFSEKLIKQISATTTLTQTLSALHKTSEFDDALYQMNVGLGAAITARTQLKVELVDTFKNKVPDPAIVRNDVALVVALVFKN